MEDEDDDDTIITNAPTTYEDKKEKFGPVVFLLQLLLTIEWLIGFTDQQ